MYHNTVCTRPTGEVVRISCPTAPQVDEFAHPVAIFDYTKLVVIPAEVGYIRAACSKGGVVLVAGQNRSSIEDGLVMFTEDGRSRFFGPVSGTSPVWVEPGVISGWTVYVVRGGVYVEVIQVMDDLSIVGDGDENYKPIMYAVPTSIRPATAGIRDVSHSGSTTTIHYHGDERSRDIGSIRINFWMERDGWIIGQPQEGIYGILAYEIATSRWFIAYSGDNQVPSILAVGKDGPVVATSVDVMAFTDRANFKEYKRLEAPPVEPPIEPPSPPTPSIPPTTPPNQTDEVLQLLKTLQNRIESVQNTLEHMMFEQSDTDTRVNDLVGVVGALRVEVATLTNRPLPNYRTTGRIFGANFVLHSVPE